jgi:cation transport ATPase
VDDSSILTTAVEVAIAIAGFSGIVVVLGPRHARDWPETGRLLLSALLLMAIAVVAFGFLPLLLEAAGVSERLWPIASALHAVYLLCVTAYRLRERMRLPPGQRRITTQAPVAGAALAVAVVGAFALQLANVFWLQASWPYLAAIVLMVLGALGVFAALLWGLWAAA